MDYFLQEILRASGAIQLAILRCCTQNGRQNIQTRIVFDGENIVHCVCNEDVCARLNVDDEVHLIQKKDDNYFFIAGHIRERAIEAPGILSISISRAFWFERKNRGHISWLKEKYRYEEIPLAS